MATEPPPDCACWICLMSCSGLLRGCACRGTSGFCHVDCLTEAALANGRRWLSCPMCKQRWTGELKLKLARERWGLSATRAEDDGERLAAALDLVESLYLADEMVEALQLGLDTLTRCRSTFGSEHEATLKAMSTLAVVQVETGDRAAALLLETEALEVNRRLHGGDHPATLSAINNLAGTYADIGKPVAALLLLDTALEGQRRVLGDDATATMNTISR